MINKTTVTFILLLFAVTLSAQNKHDENGKKHGKWKVTDADGYLKYEGQFEHGVPVGEFTHYYPYKKVKTVAVYKDSASVVYVKEYFKNGKLQAEGKYLDKQRDSTWMYYNKYGVRVKREYYNKGVADSIWIVYYGNNGAVSEEVYYEDGIKNGAWIQYFHDGTIKLKAHYVDDKMHGEIVVNYPSGKPFKQGQYNEGFRDGIWIIRNEEGKVVKKVRYSNGYEEVLLDKTEVEEVDTNMPQNPQNVTPE